MSIDKQLPDLTPDQRALWDRLGGGYRTALRDLCARQRSKGNELSLSTTLDLWSWQTPPGKLIAVCPGTMVPIKPLGINQPRIMKVTRDDGFARENLTLVTYGYWLMRNALRDYGDAGHALFRQWLASLQPPKTWNPHDPVGRTELDNPEQVG